MQATSDKTGSVGFTQTGETFEKTTVDDVTGNAYGRTGKGSLYYQWGRKDAFKSSEFGDSNVAGITCSTTSVTVGTTIQNPTTHYAGGTSHYNPYTPTYYNAWNATYPTFNATTDKIDGLEKVVKTVYDPCPVGYTVPPANTFIAFNATTFPLDGNGRKYTNSNGILFFPNCSFRYYSSADFNNSHAQDMSYWVAVTGSESLSRLLNNYNPAFASYARSNSMPIRPVREN